MYINRSRDTDRQKQRHRQRLRGTQTGRNRHRQAETNTSRHKQTETTMHYGRLDAEQRIIIYISYSKYYLVNANAATLCIILNYF